MDYILAYAEKEKIQYKISGPKQNGQPIQYKPLELWTEEEKTERDKFLEKYVFFKEGAYRELVPDPFNLGL
jgi:hypothetical protein